MGTTKASIKKLNAALNASERQAVERHGKKIVDRAFKWARTKVFEKNPGALHRLLRKPDPYEDLVLAYMVAKKLRPDPLLHPQSYVRAVRMQREIEAKLKRQAA